MKKRHKVLLAINIILLIILGIVMLITLAIPYKNYIDKRCNINILSYDTKGIKYENLNSYLGTQMEYEFDDLDIEPALTYDFSKVIEKLENITFKQYRTKDYDLISFKPDYILNEDKVREIVKEHNKKATTAKDASYVFTDRYKIVPEEKGTKINADAFIKGLKHDLYLYHYLNGNMKLDKYYKEPKITTKQMKKIVDKANTYLSWKAEYTNGKSYKANAKNISIEGMQVKVDETFLSDIATFVYNDYTEIGKAKKFITNEGKEITVSGGTWGKEVSKTKETEALKNAFYKGENLKNRTPEYAYKYDKIGKTYIEVSIEKQHCWVYKDGKMIMDTDVVTGTQGSHDTPKGIYHILERKDGKYLTGANYRTWVNRWMRLTWSGVGLHDAYWRGSFGKEIYKYKGSHGCVNLPKSFAYALYDKTYIGMPVIVY